MIFGFSVSILPVNCGKNTSESLILQTSDISSYKVHGRKLILLGDGKIVLKAER